MLSLKPTDVRDGVYVGKTPSQEDVLVVPATLRKVRFPMDLNVKGLMTGTGVDVICDGDARIRQVQLGGNAVFRKNLFCGALDAAGTVTIGEDLVSWMGDLVSRDGHIVANGEIRSSGGILARNGAIVSQIGVFAETRVFSLNTWYPKISERISGIAAIALREAATLNA